MPSRPEHAPGAHFAGGAPLEDRSARQDIPHRLIHSPAETEILLNISHASVYRLIKAGRLKKVKIGARSGITRESIEAVAAGAA